MSDAVDRPDERLGAWRNLMAAAAAALTVLLALGLLLACAPAGVTVDSLQAGETAPNPTALAAQTNAHPGWAVAFFLGDSLFALASGWFYLALARILPRRPLVTVFLVAGLAKVASDLLENILHLRGAIGVLNGNPWDEAPLAALFCLALLKRAAAVATACAATFAFPAGGSLGQAIRVAFLLSSLAALGGFLFDGLNQGYAAFFFLTLALIVWYARGVLRHATA